MASHVINVMIGHNLVSLFLRNIKCLPEHNYNKPVCMYIYTVAILHACARAGVIFTSRILICLRSANMNK